MSYRLWGKLTTPEFILLNELWSMLFKKGLLGIPDNKRATENDLFFTIGTQGKARWSVPTLQAGVTDIMDIAKRLGNSSEKAKKTWNYLGNSKVKQAYQAYLSKQYWDNQNKSEVSFLTPDELEYMVQGSLIQELELVPPFNFFDSSSQKLLETLQNQFIGIELDPFLLPNFRASIVIRIEQGEHVSIDLSVAKGEQNDFALECSYVCHDR